MAGVAGKSGGKRENSGRKKLSEGEKIKIVSVQMHDTTKELLIKCAGETFNEKILKLIEKAK